MQARRPNRAPPPARQPRQVALTAAYTPSPGGWWTAEIVGGVGLYTQGRNLGSASSNLKSLVGTMLRIAPHQFPRGAGRAPAGAVYIERLTLLVR